MSKINVTETKGEPAGTLVWTSASEEETFRAGVEVGGQLAGGEILLLSGGLGAGKTAFVKGVAASLGVDPEEVTSPSFTLVNPHWAGGLRLYHIDLYRLDAGPGAAYAVDLEELMDDESAVIAIEWAERLGRFPLPENVWRIRIEGDGDAPRRISLNRP